MINISAVSSHKYKRRLFVGGGGGGGGGDNNSRMIYVVTYFSTAQYSDRIWGMESDKYRKVISSGT